jgi:hypothetical protein
MEYPTEDEIQAMSNQEFASLIRTQAESIERSLSRYDHVLPVPGQRPRT